jgi:hypothetical protein
MQDDMVECSICFTLVVEPIRIRCSHLYCLDCVEKLIINNEDIKCPMDRISFNFEQDLKYDSSVLFKNLSSFPEETKQRIENILHWRRSQSSTKEVVIAYGNVHEYQPQQATNKHKWTAFVEITNCHSKKRQVLDEFKRQSLDLFALANVDVHDLETSGSSSDGIYDSSSIIKNVTFKLHPTFAPNNIIVQQAPFQIVRYGWGAFNMTMVIEFQEHLNIPSVEVDHFLCFDKDRSETFKQIYLNVDKMDLKSCI